MYITDSINFNVDYLELKKIGEAYYKLQFHLDEAQKESRRLNDFFKKVENTSGISTQYLKD